jgi:hypothetical protein
MEWEATAKHPAKSASIGGSFQQSEISNHQ